MNTQVKDGGRGASAPGRSMKIYFCDICNESIPLKDINSNRITIEEGKIFCQKCAPKKARSGERVPGPVLAMLAVVLLLVVAFGVMGWKLISDQSEQIRALQASTDSLDASLTGVPDRLKALEQDLSSLSDSVRTVRDDLQTAKNEITSRHDTLDQRERSNHGKQQEAMQKAIDGLTATLGGEITGLKDKIAAVEVEDIKDLKLTIEVLKEKVDILQDLVTSRGGAPNPGGGVAGDDGAGGGGPPGDVTADGAKGGGAPDTLEDKEINAQIAKLSDPDPGKRYSAVIALSRYTGDKVVKALEGVLKDPEDYVRVAVIQNLRNLGANSSIPHIVQALRDSDYFVRVAARGALRALTGTKMDFDPDASPSERETKVKSWEKWWEENKARLIKAS